MITFDFTRLPELINRVYYRYLKDYRKYQVFKGGGSAGKSVFIAQKIIYNMVTIPGYNGLILRKVAAENHDTTFQELTKCIDAWGLEPEFIINKSKGAEEIAFKGNGNRIIFKGLDNVRKLKSITFKSGPMIFIWIEEADEITEDDFNELEIRLRGRSKIHKHFMISFNPIDVTSWLKPRFFDYPLDAALGFTLETTYKDNRFLTAEDRRTLESFKEKDYYYYQVYVLNQWGDRRGTKVFFNIKIWDFDYKEWDYTNIRHGMDFGFIHANTLMGTGYRDGSLYLFREFYAKNQGNPEFIKAVADTDFPPEYYITADSAEPGYISAWNQAGFRVAGARKGPGSLRAGINYLKNLPVINIHKSNCPNAAREFPRFKYKQLKDGTVTDDYVELDDDTIAGVRYGNEEFFVGGQKKSKPVFIRM